MKFEFFKGFPPDRDLPIVELSVRTSDSRIAVPVMVCRDGDEMRITIYGRQGGIEWEYPLREFVDALAHAAEILGE